MVEMLANVLLSFLILHALFWFLGSTNPGQFSFEKKNCAGEQGKADAGLVAVVNSLLSPNHLGLPGSIQTTIPADSIAHPP